MPEFSRAPVCIDGCLAVDTPAGRLYLYGDGERALIYLPRWSTLFRILFRRDGSQVLRFLKRFIPSPLQFRAEIVIARRQVAFVHIAARKVKITPTPVLFFRRLPPLPAELETI